VESGWVTVDGIDPHATKLDVNKFFYQLVYKKGTSKTTVKTTDPIVLWLNGGPGKAINNDLFRMRILNGIIC
jgi:carboxypeptidase C (cathepsin A)